MVIDSSEWRYLSEGHCNLVFASSLSGCTAAGFVLKLNKPSLLSAVQRSNSHSHSRYETAEGRAVTALQGRQHVPTAIPPLTPPSAPLPSAAAVLPAIDASTASAPSAALLLLLRCIAVLCSGRR